MVSGEKDFLVKEAQRIIRNYMKDCKAEAAARRENYIKKEYEYGESLSARIKAAVLILASAVLVLYILFKIF